MREDSHFDGFDILRKTIEPRRSIDRIPIDHSRDKHRKQNVYHKPNRAEPWVHRPTNEVNSMNTRTIRINTTARTARILTDSLSVPNMIGIGPISKIPAA